MRTRTKALKKTSIPLTREVTGGIVRRYVQMVNKTTIMIERTNNTGERENVMRISKTQAYERFNDGTGESDRGDRTFRWR